MMAAAITLFLLPYVSLCDYLSHDHSASWYWPDM